MAKLYEMVKYVHLVHVRKKGRKRPQKEAFCEYPFSAFLSVWKLL